MSLSAALAGGIEARHFVGVTAVFHGIDKERRHDLHSCAAVFDGFDENEFGAPGLGVAIDETGPLWLQPLPVQLFQLLWGLPPVKNRDFWQDGESFSASRQLFWSVSARIPMGILTRSCGVP